MGPEPIPSGFQFLVAPSLFKSFRRHCPRHDRAALPKNIIQRIRSPCKNRESPFYGVVVKWKRQNWFPALISCPHIQIDLHYSFYIRTLVNVELDVTYFVTDEPTVIPTIPSSTRAETATPIIVPSSPCVSSVSVAL